MSRLDSKVLVLGWLIVASASWSISAGFLSLSHLEAFPLCIIKNLTGFSCPGCGMGHGLIAFFQGRWLSAQSYHPLAVPAGLAWTAAAAWKLLTRSA